MTKKWALVAGVYLAGVFLLVYAFMALDGTPQIIALIVAAVLFIIHLRLRSSYQTKK